MAYVFTWFKQGGEFMIPIAVVMFISLAIMIERFWNLVLHYNVDGNRFLAEIRKYVMANDIAGAVNFCNKEPDLAICKVVKAGLVKANRTKGEIREAVNESILEVLPGLEKGIGFLPVIANVSTLLGLLGTVQGLIQSFGATQAVDPAHRAILLSAGISVSMHCTAFGLMVAIPTLFVHSFLHRKSVRIVDDIDQAAVKVINILSNRPGEEQKA